MSVPIEMPHAVARLSAERLARCVNPWHARGSRRPRCAGCRLPGALCLCTLRPRVATTSGFCVLMHDTEPLRPSNTGWLVADVVADTEAIEWSRTEPDPRLAALLHDERWQPYLVFPSRYASPERVVREVRPPAGKRPLFVLLDASWREARRMFHRSRDLAGLPVLDAGAAGPSRYKLRQAGHEGQLCTAEAAALCLALAGEERAATLLEAWLDAFVACALEARRPGDGGATRETRERLAALGHVPT